MSLVTNYIQAVDGNFYENPNFYGNDWFICFDDDDPPELVFVFKGIFWRNKAIQILKETGIEFSGLRLNHVGGSHSRLYPPKYDKFIKDSWSVFFDITVPIPIPRKFGSVKRPDEDLGQAVIYKWS